MLNRVLLILGCVMAAAGLGGTAAVADIAPEHPLGLPMLICSIGIALITIAVVRGLLLDVNGVLVEVKDAQAELRVLTEAVNRPADEAWDAGREVGYNQGWVECGAALTKRQGMRSVGRVPRAAAASLPPVAAETGSEGNAGRVASPQDRLGG